MGWALRCPPYPMWFVIARRMRPGSARRFYPVSPESTKALNTVMLAIWPLIGLRLDLRAAQEGGQLGNQAGPRPSR